MRPRLLPFVLLAVPSIALAQSTPIQVTDAWSRAAAQGRVGVLYLTVTDAGQPDRLVGADTPVAEKAELHESLSDNGVMKMRSVDAVPVAAGQKLVLKPGGYHFMLIGLRKTLSAGDTFPVTLRFSGAGAVTATAQVAAAGAVGPATPGMGQDNGAMHH